MEILAPKEWHSFVKILEEEKGIAILLGATDTGKSTLARFLITRLCHQGVKTALVDADIGQSVLGPPATIGFSVFRSDPNWEIVFSPPEIFFVGSTTPEGNFSAHLRGVKKMVDRAFSCGMEVILVDTTGFVSGEGGRDLKRRKIELLSPRFILALQINDELEPILESFEGNASYKIHRLPASEHVRSRSMEERRTYRMNRFQAYFEHSGTHELEIDKVRVEGQVFDPNGEQIPLDWSLRINGLLVGLKDAKDDTLALGLIRNYSGEKKVVRIFTPLQDIQEVRTIQLSSQKVIHSYLDL